MSCLINLSMFLFLIPFFIFIVVFLFFHNWKKYDTIVLLSSLRFDFLYLKNCISFIIRSYLLVQFLFNRFNNHIYLLHNCSFNHLQKKVISQPKGLVFLLSTVSTALSTIYCRNIFSHTIYCIYRRTSISTNRATAIFALLFASSLSQSIVFSIRITAE